MNKCNLIADAGSTKTEWLIIGNSGRLIKSIETNGFNPNYHPVSQLENILKLKIVPLLEMTEVDKVIFYGSGCSAESNQLKVASVLKHIFNTEGIEVYSDLLAAARGLFGREAGIACILGTGSNSCLYDGRQIVANIRSTGFILGDEGSGTYIGKLFLKALLNDELSPSVMNSFLNQYNMREDAIISRIYREPLSGDFFAGMVPLVARHIDDPVCEGIVVKAFDDFISQQLARYPRAATLPIGFVGSVAYFFKSILESRLNLQGFTNVKIERRITDGLFSFHTA